MASQQQKADIESLSSLSVEQNRIGLANSNIFGGRKSSFDYVGALRDSDQLSRRDMRNSLDLLTSHANNQKTTNVPIREIIKIYNEQNKVKIQELGFRPMEIGEVFSQSEDLEGQREALTARERILMDMLLGTQQEPKIKLETVYSESKFNYHSYFPKDLAQVLKQRQIPLEYVKGLLLARDQKEIKTTRQLKVERYLEKRRIKTWNRKICYNCRQKVAQERLRIKGKFIKKRRAMQILGIKIPIDTALLKQKLYEALKNKQNTEILKLLNSSKQQIQEEDGAESDEDDGQDGSMQEQKDIKSAILQENNKQKRIFQESPKTKQTKN